MAKPVLLTVDDDEEVLRAVERDLRRRYAERYRVLRAESGASALEGASWAQEAGRSGESPSGRPADAPNDRGRVSRPRSRLKPNSGSSEASAWSEKSGILSGL